MKKFLIRSTIAVAILALVIYFCNAWVINISNELHHADSSEVPKTYAALVLGTSPTLKSGANNPYFVYRMEMAAQLYKEGKVTKFVLSGDNHIESYDEPEAMRQYLIKLGVPDTCLHLDYAGFRTLDSVVRLKAIFGQDTAIVISQAFHNERAIAIGYKHAIVLYGADAKDVGSRFGMRTRIREYLARVKCCLDLFILNKEPHFYGEKIAI